MDIQMLGERIRAARKELGLTQVQFARVLGLSLPFYGHIERGTRRMSLNTFYVVARTLDVSSDELLGLGEFSHKKDQRARKPKSEVYRLP